MNRLPQHESEWHIQGCHVVMCLGAGLVMFFRETGCNAMQITLVLTPLYNFVNNVGRLHKHKLNTNTDCTNSIIMN